MRWNGMTSSTFYPKQQKNPHCCEFALGFFVVLHINILQKSGCITTGAPSRPHTFPIQHYLHHFPSLLCTLTTHLHLLKPPPPTTTTSNTHTICPHSIFFILFLILILLLPVHILYSIYVCLYCTLKISWPLYIFVKLFSFDHLLLMLTWLYTLLQ